MRGKGTPGEEWFRTGVAGLAAAIRYRFTVDTRALATLRIALGLIILVDLIHRAQYLRRFYSDDGVYPISAYEATSSRYASYSIHAISGEVWVQGLLFVLAGFVAIAFVVGYRTRFMGAASLVLLYSLHARNPVVLNGADRLLLVLLLVAILTPLGERWSVDAHRRRGARRTVVGFTTAALLVQPLAVFTANAIEKYRGTTWFEGDALELALANDVMTVFIGNYLTVLPSPVLSVLNWLWVILLVGAIPFLLGTTGRLRAGFAVVYIAAFAGMLATLSVGLFPLVLTAGVIPFLTAPFWDTLVRRTSLESIEGRLRQVNLGPFGRASLEARLIAGLRSSGMPVEPALLLGRSALSALGLLLLLWIVLFTGADVTDFEVPKEIDRDQLDRQKWSLYAPDPGTAYSWEVVEATYESGHVIDPVGGGEVTADRPPDAAKTYETFRHRKFAESVRRSADGDNVGTIAGTYADWQCTQANGSRGDDQVEQVTIYQLVQPISQNGVEGEVHPRTVLTREC